MPQVAIRWNGQTVIILDGDPAEFMALLAQYPEGFVGAPVELVELVNEHPERLVAWVLAIDTRDPERPGKVSE